MRCAQSVPKECQMTTQEHPTPTKTMGRNASKTLTFRPIFDHDKRFLSPVRLPVSPPRHMLRLFAIGCVRQVVQFQIHG